MRNSKGGRRREIGLDIWGFEQLRQWLTARLDLPVGPLFCTINGPTSGSALVQGRCASSSVDSPHEPAYDAASRRTSYATPTQSSPPEGIPLNIIHRQLGHANLGTTSVYLPVVDPEEIIATVHTRRAPMVSATAGMRF